MNFNTAFWFVVAVFLLVVQCFSVLFGYEYDGIHGLLFIAVAAHSIHSRLDKAIWLFALNEKGEKIPMLREEER